MRARQRPRQCRQRSRAALTPHTSQACALRPARASQPDERASGASNPRPCRPRCQPAASTTQSGQPESTLFWRWSRSPLLCALPLDLSLPGLRCNLLRSTSPVSAAALRPIRTPDSRCVLFPVPDSPPFSPSENRLCSHMFNYVCMCYDRCLDQNRTEHTSHDRNRKSGTLYYWRIYDSVPFCFYRFT